VDPTKLKEIVYIETSVISYLVSRPSRDIVVSGRQLISRDWWENQSQYFELRISSLVEEGCLDMVQLRNLCVDPAHYNAMLPENKGQRMGMRGFLHELASRHPRLRFGTFNPRLAAPWYADQPGRRE